MATIETKIAKNGILICKLNGKRASRVNVETAIRHANMYGGNVEIKNEFGGVYTSNFNGKIYRFVDQYGKEVTFVFADDVIYKLARATVEFTANATVEDPAVVEAQGATAEAEIAIVEPANAETETVEETAPAKVDIETLNRQAQLYAVSGKAFSAISEALTPPVDCDDDTADQYETAYQTLKAARVHFSASRREFGKTNRDRIGQLKQLRKDAVNDRLHKVSAQVKAMFDAVIEDDRDVFSLLPKREDLNDVDGEFDEDAAEYTDRNDRYNRGEKIAADLTAKLRTVDPAVEVTFAIDDDEDTYYLSYDGIIRTPFTATGVEASFHAMKQREAKPEAPTDPEPKTVDVKKVSAVVYYTCTADKSNWAKDKYFETTPAAAEWILSFVKTRVFDCTVRDAEIIDRRNGYVRYALTDADITAVNAVNTEPELPTPKPDSPFAIARGLDDVFQKTFHKVDAPYMDVTTQDGAKITTTFGATFISVDWRAVDGYVFGNHFNDVLARYETPEQVTDVMTALRDAIKAGKTEFTFPTVDEFTAKLAALDAAIEANQPAEVKALNAELDASTLQAPCMWIRIVDGAGNHRSSFSGGSLSAVHIEYNAEPEAIKGYTLRYFDEPMELYDTFAQVTAAVEQFKAAIISNAETFTFPTVEALTPEEPAPAVEETDYEKYLKAKEQIKAAPDRLLDNGNFTTKWLVRDDHGNWNRTNKGNAANILNAFGLDIFTYLDEHEKWVAAEIARGSRQFAIDMQAEFLRDKIDADRKASVEPMPALFPADDSDDDDELIDAPEVKAPADEFTAKLAAFDAEITHAETARAAAKAAYDKADIDAQNAIAARWDFLDKTAGALTEKLHAIPPHRDYIGTATLSGCPVTFMDFDNVYVDATLGGKFKFVTCNNRALAQYDTPAQVETVIGKLKDAVERHKPVFHFPTVDELTAPPVKPEEPAPVDAAHISDSLTRAMKTALEKFQQFCLVKNLTAAENELKLYNICRAATRELWKE